MEQGTSFNMEEEFAELDLHSVRLAERFVSTMETLIRHGINRSGKQAKTGQKPKRSTGCRGMKVLTGRRSSGRTGKQRYGGYTRRGEGDNGL
jgi:hypothetical protein